MSETKREPSDGTKPIHEERAEQVDSNIRDTPNRLASGSIVDIYDALDYRLMATFPASDAVAQY
ncbi:MAG TPA: hypothetical protein PKH39_04815 [Woeseiaceae bacterium]|nr:hypothetical protein [Woeseiaceae bacterium]